MLRGVLLCTQNVSDRHNIPFKCSHIRFHKQAKIIKNFKFYGVLLYCLLEHKRLPCKARPFLLKMGRSERTRLIQISKHVITFCFPFDFVFVQPSNSTALHVAVEQEDLTSLHIVDFLAQNW